MSAPGSSFGTPQLLAPPRPGSAASNNDQQIRLQILASLFPPGSQHGAYIAHLKTWEDVPGVPASSPEAKKPRYILLTVLTDGRCKLHKSKRNANGTFSIGKTWDVQELKGLEVHKPRRLPENPNVTISCFTITIKEKSYLWESESSRSQDDFLVTLVRTFRQYLNGATPRLVGFQVGEIPGGPPAYEVPLQGGGTAMSPIAFGSPNSVASASVPVSIRRPTGRPDTAASVTSQESPRFGTGQPGLQSSQMLAASPSGASLDPNYNSGGFTSAVGMRQSPSNNSNLQQSRGHSAEQVGRADSPGIPVGLNAARRIPSQGSFKSGAPSASSPGTVRPPLPTPPPGSSPLLAQASPPLRQQAQMQSLAPPARRSGTPTGPRPGTGGAAPSISMPAPPSRKNSANAQTTASIPQRSPVIAVANAAVLDEQMAAAKAAALLGQDGPSRPDDSDVMLTNVEEMLEGLDWGRSGSSGHGSTADEIEKRLLSELSALEAAGIHAIIESDDRVNDVVKFLDNAIAEVDRMDQMLTLYRTHLNAVSDDIEFIESQNKGLQVQSSNQRALLAELEKMIGR